jgi:hypothetical protein
MFVPANTGRTMQNISRLSTSRKKGGSRPDREYRDVTRQVRVPVQNALWGLAGGRCEFAGCNKPLWKSSVTQEQVNIGQKAHIYSFATGGPRGNRGVSKANLNDLSNLILVCHECHQKIDARKDGGRYPVPIVLQMKADHEERIVRVTRIAPHKTSDILLYGANIGDHRSPLNYLEAAEALFPRHYPAADTAITLGTINNSLSDRDAVFWQNEANHLSRHFDTKVRDRLAMGVIRHLSVFALAPQPLLVLFGTLLGDITPADVYQRHREPVTTWQWPASTQKITFLERAPAACDGPPALVIALSATVTRDRIVSVLGEKASIWTLTVTRPNNDLIKSRAHLSELRRQFRGLFDRIKAAHGQDTLLHVFPVGPVSAAVEFGRCRMPKADMPWRIYDQLTPQGPFVPALDIGN